MEILSEDDVLTVRRRLAKTEMAGRDFGTPEPLNYNRFASAVARQVAGFSGKLKYNTVAEVAATLFYGINLNHAFENGNKRTALVSMLTFLHRNKVLLVDASEDDLYDLATRVAAHTFPLLRDEPRTADSEVLAIAGWLKNHSRPLVLGDRMMRYKKFKRQLEEQGCEFGKPRHNFVKIFRLTPDGELSVTIGYHRADFEVPVDQVKRVRQTLRLDELHGTDSAAFYDLESSVDAFVNKYRQLLDRLADT